MATQKSMHSTHSKTTTAQRVSPTSSFVIFLKCSGSGVPQKTRIRVKWSKSVCVRTRFYMFERVKVLVLILKNIICVGGFDCDCDCNCMFALLQGSYHVECVNLVWYCNFSDTKWSPNFALSINFLYVNSLLHIYEFYNMTISC